MILAIDQGTTGTTVLLFNTNGEIIERAYAEFTQHYPQAGWVEHDAEEIWQSCLSLIKEVLRKSGKQASDLKAIGITNQRETTVLWDRATGKPVHRAIVWQCRRSADVCDKLKADGYESILRSKTGLVVDAYFSGTKLKWIFNNNPDLEERAKKGELAFGTIDSWLIWNLTGGQSHKTDHTNASRTMLYNINSKDWDDELLSILEIPRSVLPELENSAGNFGVVASAVLDAEVPITGVAGDQQAALFGQQCVNKGEVKNTYGTGCFMLMYVGEERPFSSNGLLSTIACDAAGKPVYAFEGAVFVAGAVVQWLRDSLQIIESASETEAIAKSIEDTKGVYIVPAFTGLGAPHWNMQARGTIVGLTRGAGRAEIVRAALESIAYQSYDLMELMAQEANVDIEKIRVDGGACQNDFLMQLQADLLGVELQRPEQIESTAIGAAMLAGIGCDLWQAGKLPSELTDLDKSFKSEMSDEKRQQLLDGWDVALKQTLATVA